MYLSVSQLWLFSLDKLVLLLPLQHISSWTSTTQTHPQLQYLDLIGPHCHSVKCQQWGLSVGSIFISSSYSCMWEVTAMLVACHGLSPCHSFNQCWVQLYVVAMEGQLFANIQTRANVLNRKHPRVWVESQIIRAGPHERPMCVWICAHSQGQSEFGQVRRWIWLKTKQICI